MSFGVGVLDILTVLKKCKDIYTSFAGEYDSAPQRVQELVDTCHYLTTVFGDVTAVDGGGAGLPEELHRTFVRKLNECNHFIEKYRSLKKDYLAEHRSASITDRLRGHWEKTWQTGRYAFANKSAKELRDALELETVKLLLYLMTSMRNRASSSTALTTATWAGQVQPPPGYDPAGIESLFARLRSINNRYEREMSAAAQLILTGTPHEPDLSDIYAEMHSVWNDFCDRAGLPPSRRTPLPIDWLVAPARSRTGAVLNASAPSIHYGLPPPRRVYTVDDSVTYHELASEPAFSPPITWTPNDATPDETTLFASPTTTSTAPSALTSETPALSESRFSLRPSELGRSPFSLIPPPEFYQATAYVTLINAFVLKLKEWRVDRSGARPEIIWTAERPPGTLEHIIPRDVFPETLHSSHRKTMHVTFPLPRNQDEEHHLVWRPDDGAAGSSRYDDIIPEYQFVSAEARRVFQSDVRDRDLVDGATFDTNVIWTDRTESRHDKRESYGQDLKLWRGRRAHEGRYSLSFNVTNGPFSNRHVECELHRLALAARPSERHHDVVYLDFVSGEGDSQSTAVTDELPPASSSSSSNNNNNSNNSPTAGPSLSKKKRGLSGIFSRSQGTEKAKDKKRASVSSQKSVPLVLGDDFFANLRYLAVEFSDVEDRNGRVVEKGSEVAGRFRKLFDQKRREEAGRSPFLLPSPRFSTWAFEPGPSASAKPGQDQLPRRTSRDLSPTSISSSGQAHTPGSNRARTPSELLGLPH